MHKNLCKYKVFRISLFDKEKTKLQIGSIKLADREFHYCKFNYCKTGNVNGCNI